MTSDQYPIEFLEKLKAVKSKRARAVIDHILEYGFITTEELESRYGYNHPPRAARDVRDLGIPLETYRVKNAENSTIAAYRFGDLSKVQFNQLSGRKTFSKALKERLLQQNNSRCSICNTVYEGRYFQIDHRIPYAIASDLNDVDDSAFMLLCASCNRAKSWSCEHCVNWVEDKSPEICRRCYWAEPLAYSHIALREIRRLEIIWSDHETKTSAYGKRQLT